MPCSRYAMTRLLFSTRTKWHTCWQRTERTPTTCSSGSSPATRWNAFTPSTTATCAPTPCGVSPTFIAGDEAAFVRLMDRPKSGSGGQESILAIQRIVDALTGWTWLNEFKHTTLPR